MVSPLASTLIFQMHVKLRKLFNYFQLLDEMAVLATILFKDKFGIRERSLVTIEFNKVSIIFFFNQYDT